MGDFKVVVVVVPACRIPLRNPSMNTETGLNATVSLPYTVTLIGIMYSFRGTEEWPGGHVVLLLELSID